MLRGGQKTRFADRLSRSQRHLNPQHRPLRCELLEDRRLLSIGTYPELPGLHLVDPRPDQFKDQIIYLDFDGAEDVTYNGPVVVEGIDVPAFRAPGKLAGQEQAIIASVVAMLDEVFSGTGIVFTTESPTKGSEYSTIFVGGDGLAFASHGSFLGLAEQVDIANSNHADNSFVFSENIFSCDNHRDWTSRLAEVVTHESAHILGYAHSGNATSSQKSPLSDVAEGTATIVFDNAPTQVAEGEKADFKVNFMLSGVSASGPYAIRRLGLYEYDGAAYSTIRQYDDVYQISSQNQWYTLTFSDVVVSDWEGDTNAELYAFVRFSDNNGWSIDPDDYTPQLNVTIDYNDPPGKPGNPWASNVTSTSAKVNWSAAHDPDGDNLTYYVEYKEDAAWSWTSAGSTTSRYKYIYGLAPNTAYDVRVRAYDGEYYGSWSSGEENVIETVDPNPEISKVQPTGSSVTLDYGASPLFRVRCEDDGGDLDRIEWRLTGATTYSDTDQVSGSSDSAEDFNDWSGNYTFDKEGNYTLRATVYDSSGDTDYVTWSIHVNDPPRPDLDVLSITGTLSTYSVGDTLWAQAVVKNIGDADADECLLDYYLGTSSNGKYQLIEDNAWLGEWNPSWDPDNDMAPNEQDVDEINWGGWSIPLDVPTGTYYVYAFVSTSSNDSNPDNDWARSASFTIVNDQTGPSAPPSLAMLTGSDTGRLPTDRITKDNTPTFTWGVSSDDSGIQKYQYQLAGPTSKDWSDVGDANGLSLTLATWWGLSGLDDGIYTLRIRAVDNSPSHNPGDVSSINFTVDTADPSKPLNPTNPASATTDPSPNVSWDPSNGTGSAIWKYEIVFDDSDWDFGLLRDRTFWSEDGDTFLDDEEMSEVLSVGDWQWWVRAYDVAGNPGPWSDAKDIQILQPTVTVDIGGTISYEDREFSISGWGNSVWKPVRYASVDLLDQAGEVLHSTFTDRTGAYSFNDIAVASGTQFRLRTKAATEAGEVHEQGLLGSAGPIYEDVSSSITVSSSDNYTLSRDIPIQANSAAWNIMDMLVAGYEFALSWMAESSEISSLAGVDAIWDPGEAVDTQYDYLVSNNIYVGSGGSYDDDFNDIPILHEYGHYVTDIASTIDGWSWTRQHSWDTPSNDELAWAEAFASFFCLAVAHEHPSTVSAVNVPAGNYVDVDLGINESAEYGSYNRQMDVEGAVAGALWDLYDMEADEDDTYNQATGRNKLFRLFDDDLDGWLLDAPDISDLRNKWLQRYPDDRSMIEPIFRHHVPDIYTSTRFRDDYFTSKSAFAGTPIQLDAKLEENTLGNPDIAGANIRFEIQIGGNWQTIPDDGVPFSHLLTDSNGIGSVYYLVPESVPAGSYNYRAVYEGTGDYAGCTSSTQLLTVSDANATPHLVRTHTAGDGIPLILVHGDSSEDRVQEGWSWFLSEMDERSEYDVFDVYSFEHQTELAIGFNGTTGNAAQLADYIYDTILPAYSLSTKPILVAHSRGGLVARSFMNHNNQGDGIAGLITLGTPHHGSPFAVPDWDAISWASRVGSYPFAEDVFDLLVSPDGTLGLGPYGFDTDRMGSLNLAWDNDDSAIGGSVSVNDLDVIIADNGSLQLTPQDMNQSSAYGDTTVWLSDMYKSTFGTLSWLNQNEHYFSRIVAFAAYDHALGDNPEISNALSIMWNMGGSIFSDHQALSVVTDLLSEMHLGVVGNSANYVANDGLVPIQSALLLDTTGGVPFATIDGNEDVTLTWTNITSRQQVKAQHVWTGTSADHLWLLDATEDGYWDQITTEILDFVAVHPEIEVRQGNTLIVDNSDLPIDFGSVQEGSDGLELTFTINNLGEEPLAVGNIVLANNNGFQVTQQPASTVAGGTSTVFRIQLLGSTLGTKSADVYFSNSDGDEDPFNFKVSGEVISCATYMLTDQWGGFEHDADKQPPEDGDSIPPGTGDDYLCWAAAASNALAWTDWGDVSVTAGTEDDLLEYFADHWTDDYGRPVWAWDWWFTGIDPQQSVSTVDVAGGRFYPAINRGLYSSSKNYSITGGSADTMADIAGYFDQGHVVTALLDDPATSGSDGNHWVTCWGYDYSPSNPDYYVGVWITDSDDGHGGLQNYGVGLDAGVWKIVDGAYAGRSIIWLDALRERPGNIQEVPSAPSHATASDDLATEILVTWDSVPRADSYSLYRSTARVFSTASLVSASLSGTAYSDSSTTPGTTFYYWVTASNESGESLPGDPVTGIRIVDPAEIDIVDDSGIPTDLHVDCAPTMLGQTSAPQVFTLSNSGGHTLSITNFMIGGAHPDEFDVTVKDNNGVVVESTDFTVSPGVSYTCEVTFTPAGAGVRSAEVTFATDDLDDNEESIVLTVQGTAIETMPTIGFTNMGALVLEGDSGSQTTVVLEVELSHVFSSAITVTYAALDEREQMFSDFVPVAGDLTFNPGEQTKQIEVVVLGDDEDDPEEAFFVRLTDAGNFIVTRDEAMVFIVDDDGTEPVFSISDVAGFEGDAGTSSFIFDVSLIPQPLPEDGSILVFYETYQGTATINNDFTQTDGVIDLVVDNRIVVPVHGDEEIETDENFFVRLTRMSWQEEEISLFGFEGEGTIRDDDSASEEVVIEGNAMWNNRVYISWQNRTHVYQSGSDNMVIDTWKVDDDGDGDPRNDANRIQHNHSDCANGIQPSMAGIRGVDSGATASAVFNDDGSATLTFTRSTNDGELELQYTIKPGDENLYAELHAAPTIDTGLWWGIYQISGVWVSNGLGSLGIYDQAAVDGDIHSALDEARSVEPVEGEDYWIDRVTALDYDYSALISTENQWATGMVVTGVPAPMNLEGRLQMSSQYGGWGFYRNAAIWETLTAGETYDFSAIFRADQDLTLAGFEELVPSESQGWNYWRSDRTGTNYQPEGSSVQTSTELTLERTLGTADGFALTGDVDGDGRVELVRVEGSHLTIYDEQGALQTEVTLPIQGALSMLDDVDGDGILDIGMGGRDGSSNVYCYFYDGAGNLLQTFQRDGGSQGHLRPVAVISPGTVLVAAWANGYDPRGLFAYDFATGNEVWDYRLGRAEANLTSVADIDGDGKLESTIGWVTVHNGYSVNGTTDGELYLTVTDDDGFNLLTQVYPSPNDGSVIHVFNDLNQDGTYEILAIERHDSRYYHGTSEVHLYDLEGNTLHTYSGPQDEQWWWAVADIDRDGWDNVIVGGESVLTILDHELQEVRTIAEDGFVQLAADLTGDGYLEIVTITAGNLLRVYDYQLSLLDSIQLPGTGGAGTAIADDIDDDGVVELIVRSSVGSHVVAFQPPLVGITVDPTSGLVTTESGDSATFSVVLDSEPTADVTIGLSSGDISEGTVVPPSLIFTADNWSVPQTVTVTGVGDGEVDGDVEYTIVTAPAVSLDQRYDGINPTDVVITNEENLPPQFVSPNPLWQTDLNEATQNSIVRVQLTPDGEHLIVFHYSHGAVARVQKLDAESGAIVWDREKTLSDKVAQSGWVDDQGNIYVGNGWSGYTLWKFDPEFQTELWSYNGPTGFEYVNAITTDTMGNVYAGGHYGTGTNRGSTVVKLDVNGNRVWDHTSKYTTGGKDNYSVVIDVDSNGNVYRVGMDRPNGGLPSYEHGRILGHRGSDGSEILNVQVAESNSMVRGLVIDNDDRIFVAYSYDISTTTGAATGVARTVVQELDSSGNVLWEYRFSQMGMHMKFGSLEERSDGTLLLSFNIETGGTTIPGLAAVSKQGDLLWMDTFDMPGWVPGYYQSGLDSVDDVVYVGLTNWSDQTQTQVVALRGAGPFSLGGPIEICVTDEGEEYALAAAGSFPLMFADPDILDPHTATVDWGDGSPIEPAEVDEVNGTGTVFASHVYADNGSYEVVVTVTDDHGASDTKVITVVVENVAPAIENPVSWPQDGQLIRKIENPSPGDGDNFGQSVLGVGENIVVTAPLDDTYGIDAGIIYLFEGKSGAVLKTFPDPANPTHPTLDPGDLFGTNVAAWGNNQLLVSAIHDDTGASNAGAVYLFDLVTGDLLHTYHNPDPAAGDKFGDGLAIFGEDLLVGAYQDGTGKVYLLESATGNVLQQFPDPANPSHPDPSSHAEFGATIAATADTIFIGANFSTLPAAGGVVYAFQLNEVTDQWDLVQTIGNPNPGGDDRFGVSITPIGDDLLVGAHNEESLGAHLGMVYLFSRDAATQDWVLGQTFPDPDNSTHPVVPGNAQFGYSTDSGNGLIVIGSYEPHVAAGHAYLFDPATGDLLLSIQNPDAAHDDRFGWWVDESNGLIIVSAPNDDTGATDAGSVYVFAGPDRLISQTVLEGQPVSLVSSEMPTGTVLFDLPNPNGGASDRFGTCVRTYGNLMFVGADMADGAAADAGRVDVYRIQNSTPIYLRTLTDPTPLARERFGHGLDITASGVVAIGSYGDGVVPGGGEVHLFDAATGEFLRTISNPTGTTGQNFGMSVTAMHVEGSGDYLVVGAGLGGLRTVYIFDLAGNLIRAIEDPEPSANDYFGGVTGSDGNALAIGDVFEDVAGSDAGAVYLYDIQDLLNPLITDVAPTLNLYGSAANDLFGSAIDMSDGMLLVGATRGITKDGPGKAYLYDLSNGTQTVIDNPYPNNGDAFGGETLFFGDYFAVGSYGESGNIGAVYVYDRVGNLILEVPHPDPVFPPHGYFGGFGHLAALYDDLVVGAHEPVGSVYLIEGPGNSPLMFTDVGVLDTHTATVDWGDGSPFEAAKVIEANGLGAVLANHAYADKGTYTVGVTVTDDDGEFCTNTFTVTVLRVAPPTVSIDPLTTSDSTPRLSGTVDDNSATIVVILDGGSYTGVNHGDGTWSVPDNTVSALPDGRYDVEVIATNTAGKAGSDNTTDELLIDTTAPNSNCITLDSAQSSLTFEVSVTGIDPSPGSGMASCDIYVSVDLGTYQLWQTLPVGTTTATFSGESSHRYDFRSVARDNLGNVESKAPDRSDTYTLVPDLAPPATQVDSVDTSTANFEVQFSGMDMGLSGMDFFDVYVQVDDNEPQLHCSVAAGTPSNSTYSGVAYYQAIADGAAHTYRFWTIGSDRESNAESPPEAPADIVVTASFVAPSELEVVALDVQKGATQRSYIRFVDVVFNQSDGLQAMIDSLADSDVSNDAIRLKRFDLSGQDPADVLLTSAMLQAVDQTLGIDFGAGGIGGNANSPIGNGYYELAFDLDGDPSNGLEGILRFYRLLGDVNGDRVVNALDVAAVQAVFGQTGSNRDEDVNGDGVVNILDRVLALQNQGKLLDGSFPIDD